jgi:hypothetical protein
MSRLDQRVIQYKQIALLKEFDAATIEKLSTKDSFLEQFDLKNMTFL